MKQKKLRLFGILFIIVFAVELVLCFYGPFAFTRKATVILFPPFASGITDEQKEEVTNFLEREIALTNSYSIISHSFIAEYFIRTDPDGSRGKIAPDNYTEAHEIARELDLERFAVSTAWENNSRFQVSVTIRSVRDGKTIRNGRFHSDTMENFLAGIGPDGEPLDIQEKLSIQTPGIGITDYLVLGLLGLQLIVGLVALFGKEPGDLIELLLAPAVILFLFALIHARSANMDYVQRYIANGGQLKMAQSTAVAQAYAFFRFGPILLLGGLYYVLRKLKEASLRFSFLADRRKDRRIGRYIRPWALGWTILSSLLFAFSFPSFIRLDGLAPLAWISLVPLFVVLLTSKFPMAVFYGVVFGTIQALLINYWHGTYNYVTLHMITIAFVVEYLLFMIPFVVIIKVSGKWGFLTAPAAWTLFDYARSSGILAYPWGLIGTSQYQFLPLIQIASITGVWGVGFIVLFVNAGLSWALISVEMKWRWPTLSKKFLDRVKGLRVNPFRLYILRRRISVGFPVLVSAAFFLCCVTAGSLILVSVRGRMNAAEDSASVILLQQNTDPRKHEYKANNEKLMELTDEALASLTFTPDLIAWPEGGFKLDITYWSREENADAYWGRVVGEFLEYQRGLGTWLATGTQDHRMVESEDGEETKLNFNSSVFINPEGEVNSFYHKMRLVPFSEHFPLDKEKFSALYEMFQEYDISNWTVGESRDVFELGKMRVITPICFEDVFPDHVRRFVLDDVDIILNMSNDYWSLSPVEGRQHGILSLFRAVENQRPVLRSTSSGYTVYIDAAGQIQPGALAEYTEGFVAAQVPLPEKHLTIYTRWGDWFPLFCLGITASAMILAAAVFTARQLRLRLRSGLRSGRNSRALEWETSRKRA
jgi:apolipoprotein N-acyltransferase